MKNLWRDLSHKKKEKISLSFYEIEKLNLGNSTAIGSIIFFK